MSSLLFVWFKRRWWVSTCYCIQKLIRNCRPCWKALRCDVFSFAHHGTTWQSHSSVSNTHKLFMSGSAILPIPNLNFIWDLLLRLYWIANILATGSFYRCSRTNSYWPKLPTASGCGLSFQSTPKNPTFGLWNKPSFNCGNLNWILIPRAKFQGSRQFGFYSLWRKLRWKSTPARVRRALHSPIFGRRVQLWEIIQDLGSNSVKRFHMEKRLRSNEIGQQGCYFIRRLANNLGEPHNPTPSTPSTGPWNFGKPSGSVNPYRFEHPGSWLQIGLVIYDNFLPPTHTWPSSTTPLFRLLPLVLYSPNFQRSWTAYAITKKLLLGGQTARPRFVHVQLSDNIHLYLINPTNTSFLTETIYNSPMHLLHPLLRAHFKTRSFHHPKRFTISFVLLWRHGLRGIHSHHCQKYILTISGKGLSNLTTSHSTTTSPTRTLHASSNFSQRPSFTMKTNELHPFEFIAQWSTTNASPRLSPTHWFFENWTIAQTTSSRRPSPTSSSNLANHTLGLLVLEEIYRMQRPTKTQETVPGRKTHCELLYCTFPTHAELYRQDDLPLVTTSLPSQPGQRGRIWPHQTSQKHWFWQSYYTSYIQPRPRWLLHKHRHRQVYWQLATHLEVFIIHHEHRPWRDHLREGNPGQHYRWRCQRTYVPHSERDKENLHSGYWTHHPDVPEDDPVLHRHISLWTN